MHDQECVPHLHEEVKERKRRQQEEQHQGQQQEQQQAGNQEEREEEAAVAAIPEGFLIPTLVVLCGRTFSPFLRRQGEEEESLLRSLRDHPRFSVAEAVAERSLGGGPPEGVSLAAATAAALCAAAEDAWQVLLVLEGGSREGARRPALLSEVLYFMALGFKVGERTFMFPPRYHFNVAQVG